MTLVIAATASAAVLLAAFRIIRLEIRVKRLEERVNWQDRA